MLRKAYDLLDANVFPLLRRMVRVNAETAKDILVRFRRRAVGLKIPHRRADIQKAFHARRARARKHAFPVPGKHGKIYMAMAVDKHAPL